MKKIFLFFFYSILVATLQAAPIVVPEEISFAGMTLELSKSVRDKIQSDVDMIMRNPTYFQQKVDRANLYFPLIEKVLRDENFPDDFKYLPIQESSLVSDAVSSSNAVGYWQFKKESAIEVGLRVDQYIDERKNIMASTLGAAKYLRKNNALLQNWIYALLSYNLGAGGVKSHVNEKYVGARRMKIDSDMHWYVIRFLAHMIAYRDAVGKGKHPDLYLTAYADCENKTLKQIADETKVDYNELVDYNKWVLKGRIPGDKQYNTILPVKHGQQVAVQTPVETSPVQTPKPKHHDNSLPAVIDKNQKPGVVITNTSEITFDVFSGNAPQIIVVNGVRAVLVKNGDDINKISFKTGITVEALRHFNELKQFDEVKPGMYYYLQLKRSKALVNFHTVQPKETLWDISHQYGIKTSSILSKNGMKRGETLAPGRVLLLRTKKPKDAPVEYKPVKTTPLVVVTPPVKDTIKVVTPPDTTIFVEDPEMPRPDIVNSNARIHIVQPGETMYSVSRTYSLPVDSIMHWNGMKDYAIKIDQKLYIENPYKLPQKTLRHEVIPGETMYSISKKYGVTVDEIKKWNSKTDNALKIGEILLIYVKTP